MRTQQIAGIVAALLLLGSRLEAQRLEPSSFAVPSMSRPETTSRLSFAITPAWTPAREKTRGSSMVAGGLIGGLAGGFYSGVQLARGTSQGRDRVFVYPLVGGAMGVLIGAAVHREPAAR